MPDDENVPEEDDEDSAAMSRPRTQVTFDEDDEERSEDGVELEDEYVNSFSFCLRRCSDT